MKLKRPLPSYSGTQAVAIEHVQVGCFLVEDWWSRLLAFLKQWINYWGSLQSRLMLSIFSFKEYLFIKISTVITKEVISKYVTRKP